MRETHHFPNTPPDIQTYPLQMGRHIRECPMQPPTIPSHPISLHLTPFHALRYFLFPLGFSPFGYSTNVVQRVAVSCGGSCAWISDIPYRISGIRMHIRRNSCIPTAQASRPHKAARVCSAQPQAQRRCRMHPFLQQTIMWWKHSLTPAPNVLSCFLFFSFFFVYVSYSTSLIHTMRRSTDYLHSQSTSVWWWCSFRSRLRCIFSRLECKKQSFSLCHILCHLWYPALAPVRDHPTVRLCSILRCAHSLWNKGN